MHSLPGFCRLRMHSSKGPHPGNNVPVAFVEFKNAACAASAMATLQGRYLLSSDRGAIRIEFAKSKMAAEVAASHAAAAAAAAAAMQQQQQQTTAGILHHHHQQQQHQLYEQLQQHHYFWTEVCVSNIATVECVNDVCA